MPDPVRRYTRSSRASATDLRIPVTNGISTFVYRRAFASRRRRMQSTSWSARSASNAQDPLPVAQAEGARGVRQHLGELAPGIAVLAEQPAAFLAGQQVPLGRAHERVHAQELLRRRALHERGRVVGRELRRLHGAHERPRRSSRRPTVGAAELHERLAASPRAKHRRATASGRRRRGTRRSSTCRARRRVPSHVLVEVLDLLGGLARSSDRPALPELVAAPGTPGTGRRSSRSSNRLLRSKHLRDLVGGRRPRPRPSRRPRARSRGCPRRRRPSRSRRYPPAARSGSAPRARGGRPRTAASRGPAHDARRARLVRAAAPARPGAARRRPRGRSSGVDDVVVAGRAHVAAHDGAGAEVLARPLAAEPRAAVMGARPRGTTNPVPAGSQGCVPSGYTSRTTAVEAYGMPARSAAAGGAIPIKEAAAAPGALARSPHRLDRASPSASATSKTPSAGSIADRLGARADDVGPSSLGEPVGEPVDAASGPQEHRARLAPSRVAGWRPATRGSGSPATLPRARARGTSRAADSRSTSPANSPASSGATARSVASSPSRRRSSDPSVSSLSSLRFCISRSQGGTPATRPATGPATRTRRRCRPGSRRAPVRASRTSPRSVHSHAPVAPGGDEVAADAQLLAQLDRPRLAREERIRADGNSEVARPARCGACRRRSFASSTVTADRGGRPSSAGRPWSAR